MLNKLQRLLYTAGIFAPYLVIAVIFNVTSRITTDAIAGAGFIQAVCITIAFVITNMSEFEMAVLLVAAALLIYHCLFLYVAMKMLPAMDFRAEDVPRENDNCLPAMCLTYFLPVIFWALDFFVKGVQYLPLILIAGVFVFLYFAHSNEIPGSPVYMVLRYHFHTVTSRSGKSITLMSKRKHYRNSGQVRLVLRMFDNLLIDVTQMEK